MPPPDTRTDAEILADIRSRGGGEGGGLRDGQSITLAPSANFPQGARGRVEFVNGRWQVRVQQGGTGTFPIQNVPIQNSDGSISSFDASGNRIRTTAGPAPTVETDLQLGDVVRQFPDGTALIVTGFDASGQPQTTLRDVSAPSDAGALVGGRAPDPLGVANVLLSDIRNRISAGVLQADQAIAEGNQALDQARLIAEEAQQRLNAEIEEENTRRQREIAEANRQLSEREIATSRGRILAQDILPHSLPGLAGIQLGSTLAPSTQIAVPGTGGVVDLFNQAGVPSSVPISPNPAVDFSQTFQAPQLPPLNFAPIPGTTPQGFDALLQAGAAGSPGFMVGGQAPQLPQPLQLPQPVTPGFMPGSTAPNVLSGPQFI